MKQMHQEMLRVDSVAAGRLREKLTKFTPGRKYYPPYQRSVITHCGQVPTEDSEIAFDCLIEIPGKYIDFFDGEVSIDQVTEELTKRITKEGKFSTCEDCENKQPPHIEDPWNMTFSQDSGHTFIMVQGIVKVFDASGKEIHLSRFPDEVKIYFIGDKFHKSGIARNDTGKLNVPNVRIAYRTETLMAEMLNLCVGSSYHNKIHHEK